MSHLFIDVLLLDSGVSLLFTDFTALSMRDSAWPNANVGRTVPEAGGVLRWMEGPLVWVPMT